MQAVEKAVVDRLSGSMDKKVIEKVIKSVSSLHHEEHDGFFTSRL